jgi:hypothetical protein
MELSGHTMQNTEQLMQCNIIHYNLVQLTLPKKRRLSLLVYIRLLAAA